MAKRVYNFSAGPAVLPVPALEEAQRDLLALPGVGASVLEISHRSKTFTAIIEKAESNIRQLLSIPDGYQVLFLQGGAQLQFAMIPMNFLHNTDKTADYVLTGSWSKKAMSEAQTVCKTRVAWDGKAANYNRLPEPSELDLDPAAAYVYLASNETIHGVQFPAEVAGLCDGVPLVCDASSDFLSRPVPVEKYGILYACAQKNAGPAGVTVVIIRDDLIEKTPSDLPSMLSYRVMAKEKSLYNTPPTFGIYMVKLVTDWLLGEMGGLDAMYALNQRKAKMLYDVIGQSNGFYETHADPSCRSTMNVVFRLPNEELEAKFLAGAAARDLTSLKGHRSVGGFRASIYNAMPVEGVEKLRDFMVEFHEENAGK